MSSSSQTLQRGLRKRVIPVHYQKTSSLNRSCNSSGKNKLNRDLSNNNRSLAKALQEAHIDIARKNDQIINFQHLRTQVELSIPIFEKTLLDLKTALKETYNDTRHSANKDTGPEQCTNDITEEKPPSTDTCKEKLLDPNNKPAFSKSAEVQHVPDNTLCNGDGSRNILRSIETISESPEKVDSLPKASKIMSKIPLLTVSSQKSALKRKNTDTLTSEKDPHKAILKIDSLKLKKNNSKVKDFKISRRETFVIQSADKNDCKLDIQRDSEPETVAEIVLNNPSDQCIFSDKIEKHLIPSNCDKRKTFVVGSVIGKIPELHLNEKKNHQSSNLSELLQTTFQEVELGSKAPSSNEFQTEPELKENDSKKRTIVDHPNLKQEKCHLPAKQSVKNQSGEVITNIISPSASSSVQNAVGAKCFKANLYLEKAQLSDQNFSSEFSTKQKSDEGLSEQRIVEDMQPVDCFFKLQKNVDSKKLTKTRQSLRLKRTDVATKKSTDFFPGQSKKRSLMVESAEQMHHLKCKYDQITQDVTVQQQESNILDKNMQMLETKSLVCLVKTLKQNSLENDDHQGNFKDRSGEEVMHLNEKCNQKSSSISELLPTAYQEVELGPQAPFSDEFRKEPQPNDFTGNDSKAKSVDHPNAEQENWNLPAKQSTENKSGASNAISHSAVSSVKKPVDTKCYKANVLLEKDQSSTQNFLTEYSTKPRSDELLVENMQPVNCFLEFQENVDSKKLNKTSLHLKITDVATMQSADFLPEQNKRSPMTEKIGQTHHRICKYDQISRDFTMQKQEANILEKNMQIPDINSSICVDFLQNDDYKENSNERSGEKVHDELKKINEELDILLSKPATVTPPFRGQIKINPKSNKYNFSSKMSFARKQNKKVSESCSIDSKKCLSKESTVSSVETEIVVLKSVEVQKNIELENNTLFQRNGISGKAEEKQMYSTVEKDMLNVNQRTVSKSYRKTIQVKASRTKHETQENQTGSYSSQNPKNHIKDEKNQLSDDPFVLENYIAGSDDLSSNHHFLLHSSEKNSNLPERKISSKERKKAKVRIPKENIQNDPLYYLIQVSTIQAEHQEESMETQDSQINHTVVSKNTRLDYKKDMPNEKCNEIPISTQNTLQDVDVCLLPELGEIQSQKIPICDTFSLEKHTLMSNLDHPLTEDNFTRPKKIKKNSHRTSSHVNASKSKKVGNEFKNVRKSTGRSRKHGALKELNTPQKFEMLSEKTETTVPSDVLISKNLKLSKSVKNVSTVEREVKCDSEKASSVSNRLAVEQSTVIPEYQNDNENHSTPSPKKNCNSFIMNKSLSPCVVHLVEEIVKCDDDPKQCKQKDCIPVKKKRVKPKKGKKCSNILKENVKPQLTKNLRKDEILIVADVHEPPNETSNCEKNILTDMQPSVVLNDILENSKFSKLKNALSTDREISTSHEVSVLLSEKSSKRKILPEAIEPKAVPSRRTRKPVNYKEPSVMKKLRR